METKKLQKLKLKKTPARSAVLSLLTRQKQPISAEEIYQKLKQNKFSCNLVTIYRTLEKFYEKQLINKIITPQFPMAKFEIVSEDHHHFTCTVCKSSIDIPHCYSKPIMKDLKIKHHVLVTGHTLEFFGVCPKCQ